MQLSRLMPKPCPACMRLRARFVRWLGIALGVMEPLKETPMEQPQTQVNGPAVIGELYLQVVSLSAQLNAANAQIAALKARYEPESKKEPDLKAVP